MARKWRLVRVGLWSAVKTGFALFAAGGFIMGLFWGVLFASFLSFIGALASLRNPGDTSAPMLFMAVFSAITSGLIGAVTAFFAALFYNLSAGLWGGLELELDTGEERKPEPAEPEALSPVPAGIAATPRRIWRRSVSETVPRWRYGKR